MRPKLSRALHIKAVVFCTSTCCFVFRRNLLRSEDGFSKFLRTKLQSVTEQQAIEMRDIRFSQWWCWWCKSSGLLRRKNWYLPMFRTIVVLLSSGAVSQEEHFSDRDDEGSKIRSFETFYLPVDKI